MSDCRSYLLAVCGAAMVIAAMGCGGPVDGRPARVAFQARISLGGSPVDGAVVVLSPRGDGDAASGITDAGGIVTFSTFGAQDGVVPGRYGVSVMKTLMVEVPTISPDDPAYDPATAGLAPKPKDLLPARYKNVSTSGLAIVVDAATKVPFEIDLEP
jgi:hypothetical protein